MKEIQTSVTAEAIVIIVMSTPARCSESDSDEVSVSNGGIISVSMQTPHVLGQ